MSWNVSAIGSPENVTAELDKHGAGLSGQSKIEFDEALPHLKALLAQNFNKIKTPDGSPAAIVVHLDASGSGYTQDGEQMERTMQVTLKRLYTRVV